MAVDIVLDSNLNTETVRTVLNIYLYGESTRPEDFGTHIRSDFETSTIRFNSEDFMGTGPGRYVQPSFFPVIQDFFNGNFTDFIIEQGGQVSGVRY